jgi:hypothetical protein
MAPARIWRRVSSLRARREARAFLRASSRAWRVLSCLSLVSMVAIQSSIFGMAVALWCAGAIEERELAFIP